MANSIPPDAKLEFPLDWSYRIVAEAEVGNMPELVMEALTRVGVKCGGVTASQSSSGGKYSSYRALVTFVSETQMRVADQALAEIPGIKFVM